MLLKKVKISNKSDLEFVEKLYIESFPPNERRPVLELDHLIDTESIFDVYLIMEGENRIGFLTYWTFSDFVFAEHFAISPEFRNAGYGIKTMEKFFEQTSLPVLIEVERPESDLACRRVGFYERLGFKKWDISYEQPPYEEKYESIPMVLMTYREFDLINRIEEVKVILKEKVYRLS